MDGSKLVGRGWLNWLVIYIYIYYPTQLNVFKRIID